MFLVVFALVVAATLASALAWSGVGLIAFVPLVGLAVFPLQIAALLLRGLVFEYLGLTALGAYVTLYQGYVAKRAEIAGPQPRCRLRSQHPARSRSLRVQAFSLASIEITFGSGSVSDWSSCGSSRRLTQASPPLPSR